MFASCPAIIGGNCFNDYIEKPSIPTQLLAEKCPTILIISCLVHVCKNIVEILEDGIVSVIDIGSDSDAIVSLIMAYIKKNSLILDEIKKDHIQCHRKFSRTILLTNCQVPVIV